MKLHAAVLDDVRKMIGAAAQEKLASMRYTKHLIKAATVVSSWLALKAFCLSQERLPLCEDDVELLCNAYNIKLMFVVDQKIKCSRGRLPFHSHGKKAAVNIYIAATQCNIREGPFGGLSIG